MCDLESTVANGKLPSSDKVETSVISMIYSIWLFYFSSSASILGWTVPRESAAPSTRCIYTRGDGIRRAARRHQFNPAWPRAGAAFWSMVISLLNLITNNSGETFGCKFPFVRMSHQLTARCQPKILSCNLQSPLLCRDVRECVRHSTLQEIFNESHFCRRRISKI